MTISDEPTNKEIEFQSESVSDARRKQQGGFMPGENRLAAQFFRTTNGGFAMFHLNCLDKVRSPDAFAEVMRDAVMENNKLTVFRASSKFMTVEQLNTPCRICGGAGAINPDKPVPAYVAPAPLPAQPTDLEVAQANELARLRAELNALSSVPPVPAEKPHVHRYGKSGKCRCGKVRKGVRTR